MQMVMWAIFYPHQAAYLFIKPWIFLVTPKFIMIYNLISLCII
jgi:hypothetical protein